MLAAILFIMAADLWFALSTEDDIIDPNEVWTIQSSSLFIWGLRLK